MKISVIIPTYKPQDYLWQCLDSLYRQSFTKSDYEVILVLNGCCEPWNSDIQKFIAGHMQDSNVHLLHTDAAGVSNARNLALDCAIGEYITFIDDDDYVTTTYLEELYANAKPDTISLCYPYAFNDGMPAEQLAYSISSLYEKLQHCGKLHFTRARQFFSGPCMKLIPAHCIAGRRFDVRFSNGEDSLFMFLISDKFRWVNFSSEKAIYYRRYRIGSASVKDRTFYISLRNSLNLIFCYCKIYFSSPFSYNLFFFITRLLAAIKSIFKAKMN